MRLNDRVSLFLCSDGGRIVDWHSFGLGWVVGEIAAFVAIGLFLLLLRRVSQDQIGHQPTQDIDGSDPPKGGSGTTRRN